MRILDRYIVSQFLSAFFLALVVVTFVISIGAIFKLTTLLAKGVSWRPVVEIFMSSVPTSLALAIPLSALFSGLLVFSRLSADGETTAFRACGIGLWQVAVCPVLVSVPMVVFSLYLHNGPIPEGHYYQRVYMSQIGSISPVELLEEGAFIRDFEGLTLYIGAKRGQHLRDVRIWDKRQKGVTRQIRAKTAEVRTGPGQDLIFDLVDVRFDSMIQAGGGAGSCERMSFSIENTRGRREYRKKERDMTLRELWQGIRDIRGESELSTGERQTQGMILAVEINKRLSLSVASLAFVMLGIPLGIRSHRKESSVGIAISLLLVFLFYIFIIVGESLVAHPEVRPDLIVWIPVLIAVNLGAYLLHRGS